MRYDDSTAAALPPGPRLVACLATSTADVVEAQRLRYRVFAEEMGARLPDAALGLDRDRFDVYCDHLLVRDTHRRTVVGTYRMLPANEARKLGGFYAEGEFELGGVGELPGLVEVGRACVHPAYRTGAVLALLWAGLAGYLQTRGFAHVIGCASVPATGGRRAAAGVCRRLVRDHLAPPAWRVRPRNPLALDDVEAALEDAVPPLIRGYLRLGARVCGAPAWDAAFRTADLLLVLEVAAMDRRWTRRLLRAA